MPTTQQYVDLFHKDGFIVIPQVLTEEQCQKLREDIDKRTSSSKNAFRSSSVSVYHKMFEESEAHLDLFSQEPVMSIAQAIIQDGIIQKVGGNDYNADFTGFDAALQCHVIHNSAIVVNPQTQDINKWHQDDSPHYIVKEGTAPTNIHLPTLSLTANYYLTDVLSLDNGPSVFIPGSHLFGKPCPPQLDEGKYNLHYCVAPKGSVTMFNCQLWHRGSPNNSSQTRYISQVSYARRMIGHKYYPFMNYQMPDHVVQKMSKSPKTKVLAGFLNHGPYG